LGRDLLCFLRVGQARADGVPC